MSNLSVAYGVASDKGPHHRNEDAWQIATPDGGARSVKGCLFVVADGVSNSADGQLAALSTVRAVTTDYYATPETWTVPAALDAVISAQNQWLMGEAQVSQPAHGPLMTTLAALVLRGRRAVVAHVGDTRVYRLRDRMLSCLTRDHTWAQPGLTHVLKRALGLDTQVVPDYADEPLEAGDRFLIASDGVWTVLPETRLASLLTDLPDPQAAADALVRNAQQMGSVDNATALVVDVQHVPERTLVDELDDARTLQLPPRLAAGQLFEGWRVDGVLVETRNSLVYRVTGADGSPAILKTLALAAEDDARARRALLVEEWLMKRVAAHYFAEVLPVPERAHLYFVQRWYAGETLAERIRSGRPVSAPEAVGIGIRLVRALGVLHQRNILHRDVKPENVHLGADGRLRLLDFGVAHCPGLTDEAAGEVPGTPSYLAPELFNGTPASVASDLYAAGVTLYHALTRRYPYGEIEPFQRPNFGQPVPASRYRPDLPLWLDTVLYRAVNKEPAQRFETAEEFGVALEKGETQPLAPRHVPLMERAPLKVWQTVALLSLLMNLVLLFAWLASGK